MSLKAIIVGSGCVALALLSSRRAHSCSCSAPTVRRLLLPRHGARDVPTDATLRVFITGGVPRGLRWALANEYRLRGPGGQLVPLTPAVVATRLDLKPTQPLAPSSRYVVEQVFAFADSGQRLTDTERWRLAQGRTGIGTLQIAVRRAWFPVAAFVTGTGPEAPRRLAAPPVSKARVTLAYGGGDCGPGAGMFLEYHLSGGGRSTDVLELLLRGRGLLATVPVPAGAAGGPQRLGVGNLLCYPDQAELPLKGPYAVRLRLRSIAGKVVTQGDVWKRATIRHRQPPRPLGRPFKQPVADEAVKRWLAAPLVQARGASAKVKGPAGCAYGLRSAKRLLLATKGARTSYEAWGSASWQTGQGSALVLFKGGGAMLTTRTGSAKPRRVPLQGSGFGGVLLRRGDGIFVAAVQASASRKGKRIPPKILVTRHAPDGKRRWRRLLVGPKGVNNTKPRLALGDDGLLVLWEHWGSYGSDRDLQWALLDPRTGVIRHQHQGAGPALASDAHPGLTQLGGRFFAVFTPSAGGYRAAAKPQLLVLDARGHKARLQTLELPHAGPHFDLVPHDGQLALAFTSGRGSKWRGTVRWALLDQAAKVVSGPLVLSGGVGRNNRKPRMAVDARGRFAVAWEAYPARTLYVTLVDREGAVAPPLQLSPEQRISTVALAPTPRGFWVTYAVDYAPLQAEWLVCGSKARLEPPGAIAPRKR